MKPSWNSAPEWANYLTQDEDGTWAWHEEAPLIRYSSESNGGHWYSYGLVRTAGGWLNSLEGRP